MEKKESIYFDDSTNSWAYITKEIDRKTSQISYVKKDGFSSAIEAAKYMEKDTEKYQKNLKILKKATGMEFTFSEYLDHWYNNTFKLYAAKNYAMLVGWAVYRILIPAIHQTKDVLLHQVTTVYINEILKIVAPVSECAAPQAHKVLRLALKDAKSNGYILTKPMDGVDKYPYTPPKTVVYEKAHLKILLEEAALDPNYFEILLSLFCGLRPGEVLGLKFSDISFEKKTLSVQRQVTRDYEIDSDNGNYKILGKKATIKPPKSKSSYRTIKLPDFLLEEIKHRMETNAMIFERKRNSLKELSDYVCLSPQGKSLKATGTVLSALDRITKRCGIPHLSVRDLRHLFGTMLLESGKPIEEISKIMGHKNIHTTIQIYIGILEADQQTREYIENTLDPILAAKERKEP